MSKPYKKPIKSIKANVLTTTFSIFMLSYNIYGFNNKYSSLKPISNKDSILVFQSENLEVIKFDSNKTPLSSTTKTPSYHIINFSTSEIIFFFKRKGKSEWNSKSFKYYSTTESTETIEFDVTSNIAQRIYLDINPFNTIVYSMTSNLILSFDNLKKIKNSEFNKLGIYEWIDSFEVIEYSKKIVINEIIKDFEYSEHWRKESFKKTINANQGLKKHKKTSLNC